MAIKPAIILFDGVCNFCNSGVNYVLDRDPEGYFKFGALQSDEAREILSKHDLPPEYLDSIVLVDGGTVHANSDAVLRIARHLKGLWPVLYWFRFVPLSIRDGIYRWFASNRYDWFGKMDSCRIPTPEIRDRFI